MRIELRVLTGARVGYREIFLKPVITLGRHLESDLQLEPEKDLDVSARHAEIVTGDGRVYVRDCGSTNGTFINGRRIEGDEDLHDGDVVWLGPEGPQVEVRLGPARWRAPRVSRGAAGMRWAIGGALLLLIGVLAGAYWVGRRVDSIDAATISARNDAAVALLVAELDGKPYGATAFGITPTGLLVTNRHSVRSESGTPPTRIAVKFANTDVFLHARVAMIATSGDVDLALVQVEEPGTYPVVAGIARSLGDTRVGSPVATIGFPLALDTPMDGGRVRTSLTAGRVSKLLSGVLQLDAYAGPGSSGSPVFDAQGHVIGILWGGPPDGHGRLAYAVPSTKLVELLPVEAREIIR